MNDGGTVGVLKREVPKKKKNFFRFAASFFETYTHTYTHTHTHTQLGTTLHALATSPLFEAAPHDNGLEKNAPHSTSRALKKHTGLEKNFYL